MEKENFITFYLLCLILMTENQCVVLFVMIDTPSSFVSLAFLIPYHHLSNNIYNHTQLVYDYITLV